MRIFDDFDAWGDAISGASLQLVSDGVEHREWKLGIVDLGRVVVQVAAEGGGTICYGANTHPGTMLFLPLTRAAEHGVNGEPLDDDSLFVIPRGSDFRIRIHRRAHAWCSIALPGDGDRWAWPSPESKRVVCGGRTIQGLRRLATGIADSLIGQPPGTAAHRTAAGELLATVAAGLPSGADIRPACGRRRMDRGEIIRRAMAVIDAAAVMPSAADLAAAVGVTSRTLLRAFQEAFGKSPKQYLLLRELHAVRRGLRDGGSPEASVADILVRHGIWEFGRFAARYRRQFGELPSQTVRRTRA